MLIEVHREKLKQLSARILKKDGNKYQLQGSGILYIDKQDNAYILTAGHVLDEFTDPEDPVYAECYSREKSPEDSVVAEDYLFCVKRKDILSDYSGNAAIDEEFYVDEELDADDAAVIPLGKATDPNRSWMATRARASFLDENVSLENLGVMGFGYPKYTGPRPQVSACEPVGTKVTYSSWDEKRRCAEWITDTKRNDEERKGLSGTVLALSQAQNIVLAAIVLSTYKFGNGKRLVGTNLHKIRELLDTSGEHITANHDQEDHTSLQLGKISDKLKELEKNNTERGTLGNELDPDVKELMVTVLNKVLDLNLKKIHGTSGIDYADEDRNCAFRIVASVSEKNQFGIESLRDVFVQNRLHKRYSTLCVLTLQRKVSVSPISQRDGFTIQPDDIWDATRIFRRIWEMDREKVAWISHQLDLKRAVINQTANVPVCWPEHQLPEAPNNRLYFSEKSRSKELAELIQQVKDPKDAKAIFISGVGGIGKTDLAIWLAHSWYPDNPKYFIRYMVPTPEEALSGMTGMKKTILNATFTNHPTEKGPDEEEFRLRMKYFLDEYKDAVLIVDNFDWPGKTLGELLEEKLSSEANCDETIFERMITNFAHIIFTTRCSAENKTGITVGSISKKSLTMLFKKRWSQFNKENIEELSDLVDGHTLAVELMAKTIEKSFNTIKTENLKKMLHEGTEKLTGYPGVIREYRYRCAEEKKKLHEHLRGLFALESLTPVETKIMSSAMLMHKNGMSSYDFLNIMSFVDDDIMDELNRLVDLGWLIHEKATDVICVNPMIAIVCRRVLKFDQDTCEKFLDGIWQYQDSLGNNFDEREKLAECFDQAAIWGRGSTNETLWKDNAEKIRAMCTAQA